MNFITILQIFFLFLQIWEHSTMYHSKDKCPVGIKNILTAENFKFLFMEKMFITHHYPFNSEEFILDKIARGSNIKKGLDRFILNIGCNLNNKLLEFMGEGLIDTILHEQHLLLTLELNWPIFLGKSNQPKMIIGGLLHAYYVLGFVRNSFLILYHCSQTERIGFTKQSLLCFHSLPTTDIIFNNRLRQILLQNNISDTHVIEVGPSQDDCVCKSNAAPLQKYFKGKNAACRGAHNAILFPFVLVIFLLD